jgi:hypothetical protein
MGAYLRVISYGHRPENRRSCAKEDAGTDMRVHTFIWAFKGVLTAQDNPAHEGCTFSDHAVAADDHANWVRKKNSRANGGSIINIKPV